LNGDSDSLPANKNNPVLLRKQAGKTAIVEVGAGNCGGQCAGALRDKRVITLDLALMVAGTSTRAIRGAHQGGHGRNPAVQEHHFVHRRIAHDCRAGSAEGRYASNIIKPALSRELQCTGHDAQ
jgi:ATP-dependent Clp protease ATP-binding subunit ClpC